MPEKNKNSSLTWPEMCVIGALQDHGNMPPDQLHKHIAATRQEMKAAIRGVMMKKRAIMKDGLLCITAP